jgi:PASTA domain/IPT/TIG domain
MRRLTRLIVVVMTGAAATLSASASAEASTVTLGSSLAPSTSGFSCALSCSLVPLSGEGLLLQSPVNGAAIRWQIRGAKNIPGYALQVVKRAPDLTFTAARTSDSVTPKGPGLEAFDGDLRIEVGDYIGVSVPGGGSLSTYEGDGTFAYFAPPLGATPAEGAKNTLELGFSVEVLPEPTTLLLGPSSGPTSGGTTVTIAGTDFTHVTAVKFGGVPASSFSVESENRLTAVSPASPSPGVVDVSVTTIAGSSPTNGADRFEYTASAIPPKCVVPNLRGRKLKAAKKRAGRAGCKIGKVRALKGATVKTGEVVRQKPKAGTAVPAGTKVAVSLR